jgi:hypothetical protein
MTAVVPFLLAAVLAAPVAGAQTSSQRQSTSAQTPVQKLASPQSSPQAQVVTGASAFGKQKTSLEQLTLDHNWLALEHALGPTAESPAGGAFYRGLLENHRDHFKKSIALLEPLLPALAAGSDRMKEKQGRLTLADDYFRTFQYKKAAAEYAALAKCCEKQLTAQEKSEVEIPAKLLPELESAPAQTLDLTGSFTMPTEVNPLGLTDLTVWMDGYPTRWLFDPAENFTMIARSKAELVGLKLSKETMTVSSITGQPIYVNATVIPKLKIGDAVFRNVPAVVYDDLDLYDKARQYQIEGVLGQPLLALLGQVTASESGNLTFSEAPPLQEGAPFFTDEDQLIVAAGKDGSGGLYTVNPAAASSLFSSRFYDTHLAQFAHLRMDLVKLPGNKLSQEIPIPAYHAETLHLSFGGVPITLHDIEVLAQPAGAEEDRFYGMLGCDALSQLKSYTFDFRSMKFIVRTHFGD